MKRRIGILLAFAAIVALATALSSLRGAIAEVETMVTAAAAGVFPEGATFNGIALQGSTFGLGVLTHSDGSAEGDFQTVLAGTSLLGQPQEITLEGEVSSGVVNVDGSVTFTGTGTLDMGNGQVLTNVPFTVTVTTQGLQLVISATTLPTQTLTEGAITIQ